VQTFLPYPDFIKSARSLDYRRLGKQRVEAKQIINALEGRSKGWTNHPATKMWRGYEGQLALYGATMCHEWINRGYNDSLLPFFTVKLRESIKAGNVAIPEWLGDPEVHLSHQSNLIRKDPEFYIPKFGEIPPDLPYVWREGRHERLEV